MMNARTAAAVSVVLCAPLMFLVVAANLDYEPALVPLLEPYMFTADGPPTILGGLVMLALLLCLPVAFVINVLPMFKKAGAEAAEPFSVTPVHVIAGLSIMLGVLATGGQMVSYELRPFVAPLGSAAVLGRIGYFVALMALPAAFLLNRLPRLVRVGSAGGMRFQPNSVNLIIGAAVLQMILILLSGFALESTACAIGVPNCD